MKKKIWIFSFMIVVAFILSGVVWFPKVKDVLDKKTTENSQNNVNETIDSKKDGKDVSESKDNNNINNSNDILDNNDIIDGNDVIDSNNVNDSNDVNNSSEVNNTSSAKSQSADPTKAFLISEMTVASEITPEIRNFWWGGENPNLPLTMDEKGNIYIGYTQTKNKNTGAGIVSVKDNKSVYYLNNARMAGICSTKNGIGALMFDPVEKGKWVSVIRLNSSYQCKFNTKLFQSANLEDLNTRGEARTGRLAYLKKSDSILAYFGHQNKYEDGVRHQGGYVATLDPNGKQTLLNNWFGSHNLDQRIGIDENGSAQLYGLGDAYPVGIFTSGITNQVNPKVIYDTNRAQIGDVIRVGQKNLLSLIDGVSFWDVYMKEVTWDKGKIGFLDLNTNKISWVSLQSEKGFYMTYLKTVPYGTNHILVAWQEILNDQHHFYTAIVDSNGKVVQKKKELAFKFGFVGDDFVTDGNGNIYWTNAIDGKIHLISLKIQ